MDLPNDISIGLTSFFFLLQSCRNKHLRQYICVHEPAHLIMHLKDYDFRAQAWPQLYDTGLLWELLKLRPLSSRVCS